MEKQGLINGLDEPMRLPTPPKSPSAYTQLRRLLATIILSPILGYCLFHSASSSLFGDTASTLCPALKAHCESLLDTPSGYHTSRLSRLANTLSSSNATWVAEPGASAEYYLGGFSTRDWFLSERSFLVVVKWTGEVVLLTPEFERLRAQGVGRDKEVDVEWVAWAEDQDPFAVLSEHLDDDSPLVFDGKIRNFISEGMARVRQKNTEERVTAGFAAAELGKEVSLLRERKDQREIGLLRCANQMTLHAIRETRKKMHLGISESKTREKLSEELARVGLDGEGGLVLFGGDAALPHGSGTNRKLGREEMILIDVGGIWGGYVADITRTFALPGSKIPRKHIDAWETVRRAQHAPYDLLRSSNTSAPPTLGDLDHAARSVIASAYSAPGFQIFTHRLGHGIGLEVHEAPYLVPHASNVPRSGHVFSLEPGIYVPRGISAGESGELADVGVRLEDCFVVTEEDGELGGEWLTGPVQKWGDI